MNAPTNIDAWVKQNKRHPFYEESVTHYTDLRVHAYGEYPANLIDERRPTESEQIKDFRKKIYVGKTEGAMGKVITSLSKIRKASDYVIKFNSKETPPAIVEEETLKEYTTEYFPRYKSFDNWLWSVAFPAYCIDPNAISVTFTLNTDRKENEYAKPYPVVFHSDQIYDYVTGEYYFVKSNEISYYVSNKQQQKGAVYYYIDREAVYKYSQINWKGEFKIESYAHGLDYTPVVHLRSVVKKDINGQTLYRSRLAAMLPELKEAVREYSDLQAGVLQSMFPSYWYYGALPCSSCKGTGSIPSKAGAVQCKHCKGKGDFPFNPYEHISITVKKTGAGENPAPTPPGGIIEKDTAIIEIQDRRVENHIYAALSAVNMEHLAQTPLNQSGTAKEWDRAEASNFCYAVAEDMVSIADNHMAIINDIRYSLVVPDKKKREEMLPEISVPTKYDLNTDSALAQDIKVINEAQMIPAIKAAAQIEYAHKKFNTNKDLADKVTATFELDPLAGQSTDDILSAGDSISDEDRYIHFNISKLIDQAVSENEGFYEMDTEEKQAIIKTIAAGGVQSMSKANEAKMKLEESRMRIVNDAAGNDQ